MSRIFYSPFTTLNFKYSVPCYVQIGSTTHTRPATPATLPVGLAAPSSY